MPVLSLLYRRAFPRFEPDLHAPPSPPLTPYPGDLCIEMLAPTASAESAAGAIHATRAPATAAAAADKTASDRSSKGMGEMGACGSADRDGGGVGLRRRRGQRQGAKIAQEGPGGGEGALRQQGMAAQQLQQRQQQQGMVEQQQQQQQEGSERDKQHVFLLGYRPLGYTEVLAAAWKLPPAERDPAIEPMACVGSSGRSGSCGSGVGRLGGWQYWVACVRAVLVGEVPGV